MLNPATSSAGGKMNNFWIPLLPFIVFFAWFFLAMARRKPCPGCNKPMPPFQSPFTKTKRQWWEGGYVCQHCGCEADIAGNQVPAGSAPKRRSIITGVALLTLAFVPAVILLSVLLYR